MINNNNNNDNFSPNSHLKIQTNIFEVCYDEARTDDVTDQYQCHDNILEALDSNREISYAVSGHDQNLATAQKAKQASKDKKRKRQEERKTEPCVNRKCKQLLKPDDDICSKCKTLQRTFHYPPNQHDVYE